MFDFADLLASSLDTSPHPSSSIISTLHPKLLSVLFGSKLFHKLLPFPGMPFPSSLAAAASILLLGLLPWTFLCPVFIVWFPNTLYLLLFYCTRHYCFFAHGSSSLWCEVLEGWDHAFLYIVSVLCGVESRIDLQNVFFPPASLKCNWPKSYMYLKCTMWWLDIHCEWLLQPS